MMDTICRVLSASSPSPVTSATRPASAGASILAQSRHRGSASANLTTVSGPVRGRHVLVADAVDALGRRGLVPTVNAIAGEIGIDQSGASRLVTAAARAGYLSIEAPSEDARRRHAALTDAGATMLNQAHDWQERVFEALTEGWSRQRRAAFGQAMTDLVERSHVVDPSGDVSMGQSREHPADPRGEP